MIEINAMPEYYYNHCKKTLLTKILAIYLTDLTKNMQKFFSWPSPDKLYKINNPDNKYLLSSDIRETPYPVLCKHYLNT